MRIVLNVLTALIPLVYLVIYVIKENKKRKGTRNYLYGLIVAIIITLILLVINLIITNLLPDNKKDNNTSTTTTTTTTTEISTTSESTTTTTTKKSDNTTFDYDKILTPTGGDVLGTTDKGYEVKRVNGLYYVDGYLIANKTYSLPEAYNPGVLNSTVKTAADKMFAAAKNEKGYNLYSASGFRSYATQKSIYNRYVNNDGKAKADTYSARPGYSEHQTGLAFDVCDKNGGACINSGFDNTGQAKWLSENAYKYGFILRYVKNKDDETGYMYESWHFRYVGNELAEKLYNNGNWITMESYFGLTSSYDKKPIGE